MFVSSRTSGGVHPSRITFDKNIGQMLQKYNVTHADVPWEDLAWYSERHPRSIYRGESFTQTLPRLVKEAIANNDLGRLADRFDAVLRDEVGVTEDKREEVLSHLRKWIIEPNDYHKHQLLGTISGLTVFVNKQVIETVLADSDSVWLEQRSIQNSAMKRKKALLKERLAKSIERRAKNVQVVHYLDDRGRHNMGRPKSANCTRHVNHPEIKPSIPGEINTDYDERVMTVHNGSPLPRPRSSSVCYHDREPWKGRSGYYGRTSHLTPLSREEFRMLKHGAILHCHYREQYETGHIRQFCLESIAALKKQKAEREEKAAREKALKDKVAKRNEEIRAANSKVKRKKFEPAIHNRFVAGIAEPKKDKEAEKRLAKETAKSESPTPKPNYLKPKKVLPDDMEKDKEGAISLHFLRLYEEKAKAEADKKAREEEEEKAKLEERKKERREKIARAAEAAKSRDPKSYGSAKLRLEEIKKRRETRREKLTKKKKVEEVKNKAREIVSSLPKKPFEYDPFYVFDTTLAVPKQDVTPAVKQEMKQTVESFKEKKIRAASADYQRAISQPIEENRAKTREQKKVQFEDLQKSEFTANLYRSEMIERVEPAPRVPNSVEVKQRSILLDAEKMMLQEIHDSIQQIKLRPDSEENSHIAMSRRDFNDHLIMDPKDAAENNFYGLRPTPNYKPIQQKKIKGPPVKPTRSNAVEYGVASSKRRDVKNGTSALPKGRHSLTEDFGMLEIDRMPLDYRYTATNQSTKMKKARSVKNLQDYGSKRYERQLKSVKKKTKQSGNQFYSGPAEGQNIVESITFGPGTGKLM